MVQTTEQAGVVPHLGRLEAERLRHRYLGPEHLLLGVLSEGDDPVPHADNPAARLLRRHGPGHRPGRDRPADRSWRPPKPSPATPSYAPASASTSTPSTAASKDSFGWKAYYDAAQWVRLRSSHAVPYAPLSGTPLMCWRVLWLAAEEAAARDQQLGPEHLLVGLLRDAQEPLETALDAHDRRLRGLLGLADRGPHPIKSSCWWRREGSPLRTCSRPSWTTSTGTGEPDRLMR